jgi:hypothetical protein
MARDAGYRAELNGYLAIFNIERDPREEVNITAIHCDSKGSTLKIATVVQARPALRRPSGQATITRRRTSQLDQSAT